MSDQLIDSIVSQGAKNDVIETTKLVEDLADTVAKAAKVSREFEFKITPDKNLSELIKNINLAVDAQGKLVESSKQYVGATIAEAEAAKRLAETRKLNAEATKGETSALIDKNKAETESWRTMRERNKAMFEQIKQQKELEKQIKKEEEAIKRSQSAYGQLNTKYNETAKHAQNLGAEIELLKTQMGQTAAPGDRARLDALQKEFDQTAASAKKMHEQLLRIDESVGRSQRNVGNYKSQWNGLNFSIQQMIREVPSSINNIAMLPLALSNNWGAFSDAINQARKANDLLRASGQQVIPVWKQVAASVFSLQTAMSAGISLIVAYSSGMFDAAKKTGDFAEALKSSSGEYADAKVKLEGWRKSIESGKMSLAAKEAAMEDYNRTLADQMGAVSSVKEWEDKIIKDTEAYVTVLFLRAQATAALAAANELIVNNMKDQANGGKDLLTWYQKLAAFSAQAFGGAGGNAGAAYIELAGGAKQLSEENDKTSKSVEVLKDKYNELMAKAAEMAKANGFDLDGKRNKKAPKEPKPDDLTNTIIDQQKEINQALAEQKKELLGIEADTQKALSENEELSLEERLAALAKYYEIKAKMDNAAQDKEFAAIDAANDKIIHSIETAKTSQEEKNKALATANDAYADQLSSLTAKYERIENARLIKSQEDEKKIVESNERIREKAIQARYEQIANEAAAVQDGYNKQFIALNNALERGEITQKQYNARRRALTYENNKAVYDIQRKLLEDYINELEREGTVTIEVIQKLRAELAKLEPPRGVAKKRGNFIMNLLGMDPDDPEAADASRMVSQAIGEIYDSLGTIINEAYSKKIKLRQQAIEDIKTERDEEIAKIRATTLSEEEKEKRVGEIRARAHLQEVKEQEEMKRLKRQQAVAGKGFAIAEITAKTAIAVMEALKIPVYGEIKAAAITAMGLANIAKVIATPIPEYRYGTPAGGHPNDGPAIVGDGGEREWIKAPGQPGYWSNDKPTLSWLPRGTEVTPMSQLMQSQISLMNPFAGGAMGEYRDSQHVDAINQMDKHLVDQGNFLARELKKHGYFIAEAVTASNKGDWYGKWKFNRTQDI